MQHPVKGNQSNLITDKRKDKYNNTPQKYVSRYWLKLERHVIKTVCKLTPSVVF